MYNDPWQTAWDIELESLDETRLEEVAGAATDAVVGFMPSFTVFAETALVVTIVCTRWSKELDYYGRTYDLFRLIDARLGRIRFIQGLPRDWWILFRSE